MNISTTIFGLANIARQVSGRVGQNFPVRCQLCGNWGHSHVGRKWICDACYTRCVAPDSTQFSQPQIGRQFRESGKVQIELPLN